MMLVTLKGKLEWKRERGRSGADEEGKGEGEDRGRREKEREGMQTWVQCTFDVSTIILSKSIIAWFEVHIERQKDSSLPPLTLEGKQIHSCTLNIVKVTRLRIV